MDIELNCNEFSKLTKVFGFKQITSYIDGKRLLVKSENSNNIIELSSVDLSGKILQNGMEWRWFISLPQNSDLIKMEVKL